MRNSETAPAPSPRAKYQIEHLDSSGSSRVSSRDARCLAIGEHPRMCYISAMMRKVLETVTAILTIALVATLATAQTDKPSAAPGSYTASYKAQTQPPADCNGGPCEEQQPHIVVTLPAPAPEKWPIHDRISWAAYLVLAILGYVGIMLALSTLKKIERQTAAAETAAKASAESAQIALLHARSLIAAERPWIMISVEPTLGVENSFNVTATNRGRSPARITSALDDTVFAVDEAHLPAAPMFKPADTSTPFVPMILLPGEYAAIKTIKRDDAKELCGSEERFKKLEAWDERIFLCWKVLYNDLIAPSGAETHETQWCCWYIHGRQKSGLVIAGPPSYHAHS